ncbi:RNA-directed DNA polymerase protein [Dioscorea alata]|uniref:RNA-directed DNA polymerase protein n=1 Tax=Dioscorea alata TaxID=55571 RepID=A0ACB7WMD2_DIOAL|nr:RNA-directed DNA polymerase protein [Dioscorea alata]
MHYDKKGDNEDIWYLDNGASNHMTAHREKFQDLDEVVTGRVRFGDGSTVQIMGKGTVVFACKKGEHKALQEVYYIPKLCSNIISLGQMTEDGNKVLMEGDTIKVFDRSGKLLMSVERM